MYPSNASFCTVRSPQITTDHRGGISPALVTVPDGLHYVEDGEDRTAQSHELPADCAERLGISFRQCRLNRLRGPSPTRNRVKNPLATRRSNHARGIAGQHNISAVVPPGKRLDRDRRTFPTDRLDAVKPAIATKLRDRLFQAEAPRKRASTDAGLRAMRKDPRLEVRRQRLLVGNP